MSTMLSHSKRFIFIHNYKVAGSSISNVLSRYEPNWWIRTALRKMRSEKFYPTLANFPQHATALYVRNLIDEDTFNSYYKFAFVRNPWDWQVSLYHYMLQTKTHRQYNMIKKMTFDEYIDWRVNDDLKLQCEWFEDEQRNRLVDFVGQFENLASDFAKVCNVLSIDKRLPHKNPSKHRSYRDYYNDRTYQLVKEAFAKDIEIFDYRF